MNQIEDKTKKVPEADRGTALRVWNQIENKTTKGTILLAFLAFCGKGLKSCEPFMKESAKATEGIRSSEGWRYGIYALFRAWQKHKDGNEGGGENIEIFFNTVQLKQSQKEQESTNNEGSLHSGDYVDLYNKERDKVYKVKVIRIEKDNGKTYVRMNGYPLGRISLDEFNELAKAAAQRNEDAKKALELLKGE